MASPFDVAPVLPGRLCIDITLRECSRICSQFLIPGPVPASRLDSPVSLPDGSSSGEGAQPDLGSAANAGDLRCGLHVGIDRYDRRSGRERDGPESQGSYRRC